MRNCLLLTLLALSACRSQDDADFDWLVGTWQNEGTGTTLIETWTAPTGELMQGSSQFFRGETLVDSEQLEIHLGPPATYVAIPAGQSRTEFRLAVYEPETAIFMNPLHDYPQRISYRRDGDRLTVEISLADGSDARGWVLHKSKK